MNKTLVQTDAQVQKTLERVSYGMAEAAEALGIGETCLREIVDSGALKDYRIGRRRLIRKTDLQAFADRLWTEQNGAGC